MGEVGASSKALISSESGIAMTCVLDRDRVDVLAVAVRTPLDYAPTKLRVLIT